MKRILTLAGILCVSIVPAILAANPSWWTDSSTAVIDADASHDASENYAPANLGQLKNVATKARLHLETHLPEGAGLDIETLVNDFEPRSGAGYTQAQIDAFIADNYAPINLGQLKAVAKRFYDRLQYFHYDTGANLVAHGYPANQIFDGYPWDPTTPPEENYAPANLGQLKMVFSFDLSAPAGELPGWWVAHYYPNPTGILPGDDSDSDGLTNLQEYEQKSDPTNYYSRGGDTVVPTLTIVSGNNQFALSGSTTIAPLIIKVTDASNTPLNHAPVTFTVTSGGGLLASTVGGTSIGTSYSTTTASDGIATIYLKPGGVAATVNQIAATTSTLSASFSTTTVGGEVAVNGRQVSSRGQFYSVALRNDGTVWAWGQNTLGQLGNNTTVDSAVPVQVSGLSGIVSIATGDNFSAALKNDGTVWTWGYNNYGQIGDNTTTNRLVPVSVPGLSGVVAIACGGAHILALKSDGTLMGWGQNLKGQVGNNTIVSSKVPVAVSGLTNVVGMAAGGNHSAAVTTDGTVWTWGFNSAGQLGDNTMTDSLVPKQISSGTLSGVIAVSAGYAHTVALKSDGTVKGWGNNGNGQLGTGSMGTSKVPVAFGSLTNIVAISGGYNQTMALQSDGTAWASGLNTVGQLGDGTITRRLSPVALTALTGVESLAGGTNHAMAVKADGSVLVWGGNTKGELGQGVLSEPNVPLPIPGLSGVANISSGSTFATALKTDKTVVAWGNNDKGQLGDGSLTPAFVPQAVPTLADITAIANGGSFTLALKTDGTVSSWGDNANGQLGDNTTTNRTAPVSVNGLTGVTAIVAANGTSLALKSDGTVWSWGANALGQLGINTPDANSKVPVQVVGTSSGFLTGIAAIAGAGNHFAALGSDRTLYAWGENANGQLGNNSTTNSIRPVQILTGVTKITAGANFTIATTTDGTVWTWGQNANGQLGNNATTDSLVPIEIATLEGVSAVQPGLSHALAIKSDGIVLAWGLNANGQLGDGSVTQRNVPTAITGLAGVSKITAGSNFSLALKQDGTVYAFGADDFAQLGINIGQFTLAPKIVRGLNLSGAAIPTIVLTTSSTTPAFGESVILTATTDSGVNKAEFFQEGVKIGEATSAPFQMTFLPATWGSTHFTAIASASTGAVSLRSNIVELATSYDLDDVDHDGLLDSWEQEKFGSLANGPGDDNDGDGLTNLQEYEQDSDPNNYYNQGSVTINPTVTILSGNNQTGAAGAYLPMAFRVEVRDSVTGDTLSNAPVVYTLATGTGALSEVTGAASPTSPVTVRTDNYGMARAFFRQGFVYPATNTVSAQAASATVVTFQSQTSVGDGLWGHWKFNETTGTVADDASVMSHDGTLINTPQWATRFTGEGAITFDGATSEGGSDSYVTMDNPSDRSLDFGNNSFTIAVWVKYTDVNTLSGSNGRRIVSKGLDGFQSGYSLVLKGTGHLWTGVGATTGIKADSLFFRTANEYNDGQWHHVAAVFNRQTSTAQIYVDGLAQNLVIESGSGGTINPLTPNVLTYTGLTLLSATREDIALTVGSHLGTVDFFKGGVDDVRLYRKALTADEIRAIQSTEGVLTALTQNVIVDEDTLGAFTPQSVGGGTGAATYEILTSPSHGEAVVNGAVINYYPNAHYNGTDTLHYRVTKGGYTSEADLNITVNPINDPPLVSVGGPLNVTMPNSVTLTGNVEDIDTLSAGIALSWYVMDGPGTVTFSAPTALTTTVTFSAPGQYTLRLSANDGQITRGDSLVVTVNPSGTTNLPTISLISPLNNASQTFAQPFSLQASATPGSGQTISKVEFYEGSRKIGEDASPNSTSGLYELSWMPPRLGAYAISAIVTTSTGVKVASNLSQIVVSQYGWFGGGGYTPGNEGYTGSGGSGGLVAGTGTGPSNSTNQTGQNGGGSSAGGGGNGSGGAKDDVSLDSDGDGLTDAEEDEIGSDPNNKRSDDDDLDDGSDADPSDPVINWQRAPETKYAAISLGSGNGASVLSNKGEVLGFNSKPMFWKNGKWKYLIDTFPASFVEESYTPFTSTSAKIIYFERGASPSTSNGSASISDTGEIIVSAACAEVGGNPYWSWRYDIAVRWASADASPVSMGNTPEAYRLGFAFNQLWSRTNHSYVRSSRSGKKILVTTFSDGITTVTGAATLVHRVVLPDGTVLSRVNRVSPNEPDVTGSFHEAIGITNSGHSLVSKRNDQYSSVSEYLLFLNGGGSGISLQDYEPYLSETPNGDAVVSNGLRTEIFSSDERKTTKHPIGAVSKTGESITSFVLWRNGRERKMEDLCSGYKNIQVGSSNDSGALLGWGDGQDGERVDLLFIPVDMAADANQDGFIKFAGNYNVSSVAGKSMDVTSQDKPFRFWCNDDYDFGEEDHPNAILKDSDTDDIGSMRDLEDYARLHLYFGGLQAGISNGTFKIGLKWKNISSPQKPIVKVFQAVETDGGTKYLTNAGVAASQIGGVYKTVKATVSGTNAVILPPSVFANFNKENPVAHLLFEGVSEGKGQLVITIHDSEGAEIGEGPGIWLDLMNIKRMYARAKGTPETNIDAPWDDNPSLNTGYVSDPNGFEFVKPQDEEKKVLLYVHGIHAPFAAQNASYLGNVNVAETAYKRLWHAGYKGRFALYKWPALNPAGFFASGTGFEFNQSEYRAWKYGKGLSAFAASMPEGYQRNVLAHSQGNAVVAAAFRDYGLAATTWVITQGAIPISCFDDNISHLVIPYTTPDLAANFGYRGYLKDRVPAKVINFFNLDDSTTGAVWEANQSLFKPTIEQVGITRIEYKYYAGTGEVRLQKFFASAQLSDRAVSDLHESMAMIVKSRSRSIGHGSAANGEVNGRVDLDSEFSFGDEHGSQWDRSIQRNAMLYFERLLDEIE